MRKAVLVCVFAVLLAPTWFLFVGSLQDIFGVFVMPPKLLPTHPTLANFAWVFSLPLLRWAVNTVVVAAVTVVGAVAVTTSTAYVFAFYRWRGKAVMWVLLLAGLMVPRMSLIVPLFVVMRRIGVAGTLVAAALPLMYSPSGAYIARAYFESIPESVMEAARIDGAGEWRILRSVVAPISRPIVATIALFSGMGALGDYLWQMLQLQRDELRTMLVGLIQETMRRGGAELSVNPIGRSFAAAVVLMLPMLVIFLSTSRFFVSALGSAVKE